MSSPAAAVTEVRAARGSARAADVGVFADMTAVAAAAATPSPVRRAAADFWLGMMFRFAGNAFVTRVLKSLAVDLCYRCSQTIRRGTTANARRVFGPDVTPAQMEKFRRGVIASFYDFVCDVGQSLHLSREQLLARVEYVEGHEHYLAARTSRKGAIVATAHVGSFEAGAAALLEHEAKIHVVFKRDPSRFEQVRCALRCKLGILEAPVDEGFALWLRLREALHRDEVVMLQADRVMPGQKGQKVPFLHGHVMLPSGPVKLAMASGAPIIPIFSLRTPTGGIRIRIEPAITVDKGDADGATLKLARVIEAVVGEHPEQWLMFQPAFVEDAPEPPAAETAAQPTATRETTTAAAAAAG
jgi:KDO2-lipid IV(A) lauroyltransferase